MRTSRVLALVAALIGSLVLVAPARAAAPASSASDDAGSFIVTLRDGVSSRSAAAEYRRDGVEVSYVYEEVLNGFAGAFTKGALGRLQADGRVVRIERDGVARASAVTSWGLDRIDQRYLDLDQTFDDGDDGTGVRAYVIDTGIYAGHSQFGGRVVAGYDAVGGGTGDCNGHGTHVAGTIGGATYGIARNVTLVPVRVLNCQGSGTWSGVIAGMDFVYAQVGGGDATPDFPAVANMSLGGGLSSSVNSSASRLAGVVTLAVAAGNSNANACNYSPASAPNVVTVAATTSTDARASYSNYGSCVEIFAPGSGITSAWIGGSSASSTISGTSMASPHVAGVAATLASGRSVSAVKGLLDSTATPGAVSSVSGSPNKLLFNGSTATHGPTLTLSRSCSGGTCTFTATGRDPDGQAMTFTWAGEPLALGSIVGPTLGKTTRSGTETSTGNRTYTVTVSGTTVDGAAGPKSITTTCTKKGSRITCK